MTRVAKCSRCEVWTDTHWWPSSTPRDRYGRVAVDKDRYDGPLYCSETCRDAAEAKP